MFDFHAWPVNRKIVPNIINKLEPADFIALVIITGCLMLFAMHNESEVIKLVLISVTSYYFGKKSSNGNGNGHAPEKKIELP